MLKRRRLMLAKQPYEMTLDELRQAESRAVDELRRCKTKPLHIRMVQAEPIYARLQGIRRLIKEREDSKTI